MNEKMFSSRRVFILLLILLTVAVAFILVYNHKNEQPSYKVGAVTDESDNVSPKLTPEEIMANYQTKNKDVVADYLLRESTTPLTTDMSTADRSTWISWASGVREGLLDLHVPGEYRDLHVDMVFAFNDLVIGLEEDFSLVKGAQEKIDSLISQNAWLTE